MPSTIGDLVRREGLSEPRGRPRRAGPLCQPFLPVHEPNDLWCIDFKGCTADGQRCDPLTITDADSRFLIPCRRRSRRFCHYPLPTGCRRKGRESGRSNRHRPPGERRRLKSAYGGTSRPPEPLCRIVPETIEAVRPVVDQAFGELGLPRVMDKPSHPVTPPKGG